MVPDSTIELTGFSCIARTERKSSQGKAEVGGVCFYINNLWKLHSIKSFFSPDLEFHMLLCRPFWLPREFPAIIIMAVSNSPSSQHRPGTQGNVWNISEQENCAHQMRRLLLRGTLIKPNFRTRAPKYFQHTHHQHAW